MKQIFTILLFTFAIMSLHAQSVVIDGVANDTAWLNAKEFPILTHTTDQPSVFSGPADMTAFWRAIIDTGGINLLVHITADDIHAVTDSIGGDWEQDRVEVYFDMNDTIQDGGSVKNGSPGHYQYASNTKVDATVPAGFPDAQQGIVVNTDNSVVFEIFIPWTNILDKNGNAYDPKSNKPFGFDVLIGDNDNNPTDIIDWLSWHTPTHPYGGVGGLDSVGLLDAKIASILTPTKLTNLTNNANSSVYPSLAENYLMIANNMNATKADIYDLTGRNLMSVKLSGKLTRVDIGNLRNGMYVVKLSNNQNQYVQKIMVK